MTSQSGSLSSLGAAADTRIYQGVIQPRGFPSLPEGWVSEWETFASADGTTQLFSVTHHATPWASAKTLIVFHGQGEHGGRYLHFPHYLRSAVDAVRCVDHRGHGRSEGLRGHVDQFSRYSDDAALAIRRLDEMLRARFGKSEIHVLGHSMGGLVALQTLLRFPDLPIRSAAISAPLLKIKVPIPRVKEKVGVMLANIWGSLQMTNEVDANLLTHDRAVADVYRADRLVHDKVTPRFYVELTAAMAEVRKRDSGFDYPLLMLVPLADEIVDPDAALEFFRRFRLRDKALKTYPGLYHEAFNEPEKEAVFEDLRSWIASHP